MTENPGLDDIFWRDEILQVMYWIRGEQLQSSVTATDLEVFISAPAADIFGHLERMVAEGYLQCQQDTAGFWNLSRYTLSSFGVKEGGRTFAADFAEMTKPAHADCPPN